ncbi:MAG: twin-arginine translocase TatA/TatE family subunit [Deltaproteobacteria bacterium]|nr:twin-arginine translocase TatA/TatE family subunit [Deltaproteobacteria bacterium]
MGGLGMQELLIVLIVAMFLFGGKKLPEIGQNLGKAIRGFKQGSEGEEEKAIDEASRNKNDSPESEEAEVKEEKKEEEEEKKETPPTPTPEEPKEPETDSPEEKI